MLNELPGEIFINVAVFLDFYSKINLAKTCHKFRNILYGTVLFEDFTIPPKRTKEVINMFSEYQLDGSKVKYCSIDHSQLDELMLLKLPSIFPTLKGLTCPHELTPARISSGEFDIIRHFKDRLQEAKNCTSHRVIKYLPTVEFTKLRVMDLNLGRLQRLYNLYDILSSLKNAPSLAILSLHDVRGNIILLETLHSVCLELKQLQLYCTNINISSLNPDQRIEPTNTLETFKIYSKGDVDGSDYFLFQYLNVKYPKLKSMDVLLYNERQENGVREKSSKDKLELLNQLIPRLQCFRLDMYLMEDFIDDSTLQPIMNCTSIGFYTTKPNLSNMFRSLKGLLYINYLTKLNSLSLPFKHTRYSYHHSISFPNIKYLHLFDDGFTEYVKFQLLNLDELLLTYRGLVELEFDNVYSLVTVNDETTNFTHNRFLRKIKMVTGDIDADALSFIEKYVPNLSHFDLATNIKYDLFKLHIPHHTISALDLKVFYACDASQNQNICYRITTQWGTQRIGYFQDNAGCKRVKYLDDQEHTWTGSAEIICKDIFGLKLRGLTIF